jgi:glycosyltransferase involved in cell wall biosynthesis
MKKILFYSDCEIFGGSERMLPILMNDSQLQKNFEVFFAFRRTREYEKGLRGKLNSRIKVHPLSILDPDYLRSARFFRLLKNDLAHKVVSRVLRLPIFIFDVLSIANLIKEIKPDLIHINNGGYPGALSCRAAVLSAKIVGIKSVVMVINNIAVEYSSLRRQLQRPLDTLVSKNVSLFITGSKYASEKLAKVLKFERSKSKSIWNGVAVPNSVELKSQADLNSLIFPVADLVIGMVAQLIPRKGHSTAIEAVANLAKSHSLQPGDLVLLIEGSGPLKGEILSLISEMNLTEFVFLVGEVKNIFNFIEHSDIMLLTSISDEDLPNVISEAMALGKPIVASNLSGIPEQVIPGKNGFLCSPGAAEEFSSSLNTLRADYSMREAYGKQSRAMYLERFSPEVSTPKYLLEYDLLL